MKASRSKSPAPATRTIVSPWVDTLCVGGGSLIILLPLLATRYESLLAVDKEVHPWMTPVTACAAVLINMPHFMASYRMVYRSRETIFQHKWAAIYVPLFLLVYGTFAVCKADSDPIWSALLAILSGGYLAWHYTGQAWGMMAAYAHLSGTPFDRSEVRIIRGGMRILLAWHLTWFLYIANGDTHYQELIAPFYVAITNGTALAGLLGLWGFVRYTKRTGQLPPVRVLLPWGAIFIWYAAMAQDPGAIFWVQIAHALQYLLFPLRVEWNRTVRQEASLSGVRRHMFWFATLLVGGGLLMQYVVPNVSGELAARVVGDKVMLAAMMTPNLLLNIHHYFTDGAIWKLRQAEVRNDLFGHLPKSG